MAGRDLPEGYTYRTVDVDELDERIVHIREIDGMEKAKEWLKLFMEVNSTTWSISKTFPEGRCNIFKQYLFCQHADDRRVTGQRSSKKTNCPARLQIIVHRNLPKSSSKIEGRFDKEWPTVVKISKHHNHSLSTAAILAFRKLSDKSKEKLLDMFRRGHSPSSALHCLKSDFLLEHGENYHKIAGDGYFVPSLSITEKLFYKAFSQDFGSMNSTDMVSDSEECIQKCSENNEDVSQRQLKTPNVVTTDEKLLANVQQLSMLISRIKEGVQNSPEIFGPALNRMMRNSTKFASTDAGLVAAMNSFAAYSKFHQSINSCSSTAGGYRRYGVQNGVQPTGIGRKMLGLSKKRKLLANCSRPSDKL